MCVFTLASTYVKVVCVLIQAGTHIEVVCASAHPSKQRFNKAKSCQGEILPENISENWYAFPSRAKRRQQEQRRHRFIDLVPGHRRAINVFLRCTGCGLQGHLSVLSNSIEFPVVRNA